MYSFYFIISAPGSVTHIPRDEILVFQPTEMSKVVNITIVSDLLAGECLEVFNLHLSSVRGQPADIQNGLAQVIISDDDEFQGIFSGKDNACFRFILKKLFTKY